MTYPIVAVLVAATAAPQARRADVSIPEAARGFVVAGTRPIAFELGDLNRDGRQDAVMVLERQPASKDDDLDFEPRPLLILLGQPDGRFRQVKRNDKIIPCQGCGGTMGDPLGGVGISAGTFTVSSDGGTGWRWGRIHTFSYSRRDDTWQLVRVEEDSWHVGNPDKHTTKVSTPPKDFGKIDIADFDPDNWENQGQR